MASYFNGKNKKVWEFHYWKESGQTKERSGWLPKVSVFLWKRSKFNSNTCPSLSALNIVPLMSIKPVLNFEIVHIRKYKYRSMDQKGPRHRGKHNHKGPPRTTVGDSNIILNQERTIPKHHALSDCNTTLKKHLLLFLWILIPQAIQLLITSPSRI